MTEYSITNGTKCELSHRRLAKFGPMPPAGEEGRALWLRQMDEVAAEAGLPNMYRTHPYRSRKLPEAAE